MATWLLGLASSSQEEQHHRAPRRPAAQHRRCPRSQSGVCAAHASPRHRPRRRTHRGRAPGRRRRRVRLHGAAPRSRRLRLSRDLDRSPRLRRQRPIASRLLARCAVAHHPPRAPRARRRAAACWSRTRGARSRRSRWRCATPTTSRARCSSIRSATRMRRFGHRSAAARREPARIARRADGGAPRARRRAPREVFARAGALRGYAGPAPRGRGDPSTERAPSPRAQHCRAPLGRGTRHAIRRHRDAGGDRGRRRRSRRIAIAARLPLAQPGAPLASRRASTRRSHDPAHSSRLGDGNDPPGMVACARTGRATR